MSERNWLLIETAPDYFNRPGGQLPMRLLCIAGGKEFETVGRRAYFNNSGWREELTNAELRPTHWAPIDGGAKIEDAATRPSCIPPSGR